MFIMTLKSFKIKIILKTLMKSMRILCYSGIKILLLGLEYNFNLIMIKSGLKTLGVLGIGGFFGVNYMLYKNWME